MTAGRVPSTMRWTTVRPRRSLSAGGNLMDLLIAVLVYLCLDETDRPPIIVSGGG